VQSTTFVVRFIYVCVDGVNTSIDRVAGRAVLGGHSGSEDTVRDIRAKSLAHLPRALHELGKTIDILEIYDNSAFGIPPKMIAAFQGRQIVLLDAQIPPWLVQALEQTPYASAKLLALFQQKELLPEPSSSK